MGEAGCDQSSSLGRIVGQRQWPGDRPGKPGAHHGTLLYDQACGQNTGLGLSISRSIVLEHGGTLELDPSSPHACFVVKLPLSDQLRSTQDGIERRLGRRRDDAA